MVSSFSQCFVILKLLVFLQLVQATSIKGPTSIKGYIGENALFLWNRTDQGKIFSVKWGIEKGSKADPWYINVNVANNRVNKNIDIKEILRKRIEFIGDLNIGRAWFVLKNLSVSDTEDYIASISKDGRNVHPYSVTLKVLEKKRVKPTEESSLTTKTPISDYKTTTVSANNTGTPAVTYKKTLTTTPHPSSTNTAKLNNGLIILMAITLLM